MAKPHIHKGYKMYRRLIVDTVEPSRNEAKWSSRNFKWNYYVKKKKKKKRKRFSHLHTILVWVKPFVHCYFSVFENQFVLSKISGRYFRFKYKDPPFSFHQKVRPKVWDIKKTSVPKRPHDWGVFWTIITKGTI